MRVRRRRQLEGRGRLPVRGLQQRQRGRGQVSARQDHVGPVHVGEADLLEGAAGVAPSALRNLGQESSPHAPDGGRKEEVLSQVSESGISGMFSSREEMGTILTGTG